MKVLHINFSDTGGAAIAAMNLHKELLQEKVDSKFLALNLTRKYRNEDQVYSHRRIYTSFYRKLYYLYLKPRLTHFKSRYITKANSFSSEILSSPYSNFNLVLDPLYKEADVIHLHWVARFLDYPTFFKKNKKPIIWTLHDKNPFSGILHCETEFPSQFSKLEKKIISLKIRLIQNQNILVHAPSREYLLRSENSELLGSFKHVYLPHFVKGYFPIKNQSKDQLRRELNLPLRDKLILVVADDLHRKLKGVSEIVELARSADGVKFLFVGKKLNLGNLKIIELGYINDTNTLNKVYNAVDLTLSNSREESYGLTLAESLSAGTPVVARKIGGFKDYIIDGGNGVFIDGKLTIEIMNSAFQLNGKLEEEPKVSKYIDMYRKQYNLFKN